MVRAIFEKKNSSFVTSCLLPWTKSPSEEGEGLLFREIILLLKGLEFSHLEAKSFL